MKKVILILLAVLLVAGAVGTCFADSAKPCCDDLETKIKELDNVRDCKIICFRGYCFVALRTQGIMTKTNQNALVEKVTAVVSECCPRTRKVFVSTSVKTFSAMDGMTEENIWEQLIKLFNLNIDEYPLPKPKPMPFPDTPKQGEDSGAA